MNLENRLERRWIKISNDSVHIAPVGFEEDRITHGLVTLGVNKVYLLIDKKKNKWGKESQRHADNIKKKLKEIALEEESIIEKRYDPTKFESTLNKIEEILKKRKKNEKMKINISSSTKLCAVAAYEVARHYENTVLYYVVPAEYNFPRNEKPFSSGASRIEMFFPGTRNLTDLEMKIMKALYGNEVGNLRILNDIIIPDEVNKKNQAKLSYHLRKLEDAEYVLYKRGKSIRLTDKGRDFLEPLSLNERY